MWLLISYMLLSLSVRMKMSCGMCLVVVMAMSMMCSLARNIFCSLYIKKSNCIHTNIRLANRCMYLYFSI